MTEPNSKYRFDIDGLRAIAILAVVSFHAFPEWIQGGFVGVDIFFVISGFLISNIIFKNLESGDFSFADFYKRRVRRIFPAVLAVLISCFSFGWLSLTPGEFSQLGKHIVSGAGFISNFILWRESGYFDGLAETKPLLHLWSLALEEQFYILWPLLLWVVFKFRLNFLFAALVLGAASFYQNVSSINHDPIGTFYHPSTRFWEILAGSILAYLLLHPGKKTQKLQKYGALFSAFGLLCITYAIAFLDKTHTFPGWWALIPVVGSFCIIFAPEKTFINRAILSNRILVWFGLISFPLYLWHWPILSFARIIESENPNIYIRFIAVAMSLIFAILTYYLIEKPVRFGHHIKTLYLVLMMVAVGLAGQYTKLSGGLGFHKGLFDAAHELKVGYPHPQDGNCSNLFPQFTNDFSVCLLSKQLPPEILILGDSHSNQYFTSFANQVPDKAIMNLGKWSCLPFSSKTHLNKNECRSKFNMALKFAAETPSIKTVYIAGHWSYLSSGEFLLYENFRLPSPQTEADAAEFINYGNLMISTLIKSDKEVIFIKDIPYLDFNIKDCFPIRPFTFTSKKVRDICGFSRHEFDIKNREYSDTLSRLFDNFSELKIYDPLHLFCDDKFCKASLDGKPLYFNSDHLTLMGADLVVRDLLNKYPPE